MNATKFRLGEAVRLKERIRGKVRKQYGFVRSVRPYPTYVQVELTRPLRGFTYWNADELESIV